MQSHVGRRAVHVWRPGTHKKRSSRFLCSDPCVLLACHRTTAWFFFSLLGSGDISSCYIARPSLMPRKCFMTPGADRDKEMIVEKLGHGRTDDQPPADGFPSHKKISIRVNDVCMQPDQIMSRLEGRRVVTASMENDHDSIVLLYLQPCNPLERYLKSEHGERSSEERGDLPPATNQRSRHRS